MENSLFQYKIPTRVDMGKINVEFENSYEPNGPFGAKSIGEVVINTPLPAISDAIYNAIGTRFYELPITPEKIAMEVAETEGAVLMTGLEALPFLGETGHVISLVGGGGKTTLLYALARWYSAQGQRVLVSTTTHIQRPDANYAPDEAARDALWQAGTYAVAGAPGPGREADHAALSGTLDDRGRHGFAGGRWREAPPCKAPAAHEPVLLPQSDIVLAVAGLSAVGKPLQDVCFRLETACTLLAVPPETILTPALLAKLLADEQGGRKAVGARHFYAVLNQADTPQRQAAGEKTKELLRMRYGVSVVLTTFSERERA